MDLCSIHVKTQGPFLLRDSILEKPFSLWTSSSIIGGFPKSRGIFDLSLCVSNPWAKKYFVARASGRKNKGNSNDDDNSNSSSSSSSSGGDSQSNDEGDQKGGNPSESDESEDLGSLKSHSKLLNWRDFRAGLYIQEQAEIVSNTHNLDQPPLSFKPSPQKWAHPISAPENGCLLVATEKLDGVRAFERTVVLLLRSGTRHPLEGPFGVVINRPSINRIKDIHPSSFELQTTFAECPMHFGGPLPAIMFLLKSGDNPDLQGFEEVIPGVRFGARNSLKQAAALVREGNLKMQDFWFFGGYAGWQLEQLREEIESDYWCVAASSANLIVGASQNSTEGLWEEVLQLMGGKYSELSRKPKQEY